MSSSRFWAAEVPELARVPSDFAFASLAPCQAHGRVLHNDRCVLRRPATAVTRLLYGNLDAELAWGPPDLRELPARVRAMIAAAATTMAAFARPGDELWLPTLIDEARLPVLPGIERPTLVTGALPREVEAILPWGATGAAERLRRRASTDHVDRDAPPTYPKWIDVLWQVASDPQVAARVNHRVFAAELRNALGIALPGSRVVRDLDELDAHLAAGGADAGHEQRWIIKAPLSASGRLRLRQQGARIEPTARVRAGRLVARYGPLVFEPWMDRVADYGVVGFVTDEGRRVFRPHRLRCDAAGVFRALTIDDDAATDGLRPDQKVLLDHTTDAVAEALAEAGYRGPFGIDAYIYRDASGDVRLHPLSEINARISFGHVGRALVERCGDGRGTLHLASGPVPEADNIIPLLLPGKADTTCAWLTR